MAPDAYEQNGYGDELDSASAQTTILYRQETEEERVSVVLRAFVVPATWNQPLTS